MASIAYAQKNHDAAEVYAVKALTYREEHILECASTLDLIGCIHLGQRNYDKAHDSFDRAFRVRKRHFRSKNNDIHPDLARSHEHLGGSFARQREYRQAVEHYQKAANIYEQNYMSSHPLVMQINQRLNSLRQKLSS